MSSTHFAYLPHRADLQRLEQTGRHRVLRERSGVDFSSNDYLGLATSNELRAAAQLALEHGVAMGSGGSRLLRGNWPEHEALEAAAARFFGCETALYFATGFAANVALLATLPQRGDLVLYDALIHASAHDGMRLSRAASLPFPHNDVSSAGSIMANWRNEGGTGIVWIAVESLYSMDGDRAPLSDFAALAGSSEAMLLIDEAHATGVYGQRGEGLAGALQGQANVIALHTMGKALGCEGALVCGPQIMREFMINRARPFIFSTAPSPFAANVARAALELVERQPERRRELAELVDYAGEKFRQIGITTSGSHILPVIIGDDVRTMHIARTIQAAGFDVRGIRPPTVPQGTS